MSHLKLKLLALSITLVWGFPMVLLPISSIFSRAIIDVEGKVIQSSVSCPDPSNRTRCNTFYVIQPIDGGSIIQYVSGYADSSIAKGLNLVNGTEIQKLKWRLYYTVNGVEVDDFPLTFDLIIIFIGVAIICIGVTLFLRAR